MVWECIVQHSFMRHNNIVQHHDCNDKYFYCVCKWNNSHLIILHWLHPTFTIRSKSWDFLQLIWSLLKIASVKKVNNWDKMLEAEARFEEETSELNLNTQAFAKVPLIDSLICAEKIFFYKQWFCQSIKFQLVLFCLEPQLVVL